MELEEKAGLICVIWEIFLILSASFVPPVWHAFLWLLASGNIFLEIIERKSWCSESEKDD